MKKFLRTMASVAILATLAGTGAQAFAADKDYVCKFGSEYNSKKVSDYISSWQTTVDNNTYNVVNFNNNNNGWEYVKCGQKSTTNKASISTDFSIGDKVKKVAVAMNKIACGNEGSLKITLNVFDGNDFTGTPAYTTSKDVANNSTAVTTTFEIADADQKTVKYYQVVFDVDNKTTKNGAVELASVTFTAIEGTAPADAVDAPVLELVEGTDYTYTVKMSCATEGAEIYYTDDETDPTAASTKYTTPVEAWPGMTLKAIAIKGSASSPVTTYNPAVPVVIDSFSPMLDFPEGTEIIVNGKMTAVYQNGNSLYAKDSNGAYMLIFGKLDKELKNGDTFNVLKGVYKPYKGLPEVASPEIVGDVTTGGAAVEPMETTIDMLMKSMLNMYFKLDHVSVSAFDENRNATMKDADGNEFVLRDNFKLFTENFKPTECMNVTGFLAIFGETLQFYPTAIEAVPLTVTVTLPDGSVAEEGGTYTIKVGEKIVATAEGADMINIYADKEGSDEKIDVSTEEGECEGTLEWTAEKVLDSWNMVVSAEAGLLKESVSFTLSVEEEDSGVEVIETAGAATYFNLQGVRVEKPAKGGIYIRVADGKASKVVK